MNFPFYSTHACVIAILLAGVLAKAITSWTLRALALGKLSTPSIARRYLWGCRLHMLVTILASALGLLAWHSHHTATQAHNSIVTLVADRCLLIVALTAPWIISWLAFFELDRKFMLVEGPAVTSYVTYLCYKARYGFGSTLVPILALLAWTDAWHIVIGNSVTNEIQQLIAVAGIVTLAIVFPPLLARIWPTERLADDKLRHRLLQFASDRGVAISGVLLWHTNGTQCNAAAAGGLLPWRYILLSDVLQEQLHQDELLAAYAHEVGHLRLRHPELRLAMLIGPLAAWGLFQAVCIQSAAPIVPDFHLPSLTGQSLSEQAIAGEYAWPLMGLLALWAIGFGSVARRFELQADAWAVRELAGIWGPVRAVAVYRRMLEKITGNRVSPSTALVRGHRSHLRTLLEAANGLVQGRSWLHPSYGDRSERLGCSAVPLDSPESPGSDQTSLDPNHICK